MTTFSWISFYTTLAQNIATYSNHRKELFDLLVNHANGNKLMAYLHFDRPDFWAKRNNDIDPFTIMAIFNRATTPAHRTELAGKLGALFNVKETPPTQFHGIAHLDPRNSIYNDPSAIWELFLSGLNGETDSAFQDAWDQAISAGHNGLAMLSIALFWINPDHYMPLDAMSLPLLAARFKITPLPTHAKGSEYVKCLQEINKKMQGLHIFPELALEAWNQTHTNE